MGNPVKFAIYKRQSVFDAATKDPYTLYFVEDTLSLYQGGTKYSDIITVEAVLPGAPVPNKLYWVVSTESMYFSSPSGWAKIYPVEASSGGTLSGVGVTLNGSVIGGVKNRILENDLLKIPENYQYIVKNFLSLGGIVHNDGEIYIE